MTVLQHELVSYWIFTFCQTLQLEKKVREEEACYKNKQNKTNKTKQNKVKNQHVTSHAESHTRTALFSNAPRNRHPVFRS